VSAAAGDLGRGTELFALHYRYEHDPAKRAPLGRKSLLWDVIGRSRHEA